jgi:uncharacterized protein YbjT (DUF2867 family)
MKIVVIGGTGLIGSKVVARLRQAGHEVIFLRAGAVAVVGAQLGMIDPAASRSRRQT